MQYNNYQLIYIVATIVLLSAAFLIFTYRRIKTDIREIAFENQIDTLEEKVCTLRQYTYSEKKYLADALRDLKSRWTETGLKNIEISYRLHKLEFEIMGLIIDEHEHHLAM